MKNIWENTELQSLNRLQMRSSLITYNSEDLALQETVMGPEKISFTKSPNVKCLDGEWDFFLSYNPDDSFECENWNKIKVPGTWTLQGYDHPHYTNVQMPFDTIPPNVPEKNPTGHYKLNVKLPSHWNEKRVILHIGSAESVTEVYINKEFIGLSKDTRLPCEFDLTPYITDYNKEIEIGIKVIRYSDASFVEDQDQWWFGGIHRSVYLYATENLFIEDVEALSKVENEKGIIPLTITVGYKDYNNYKITNAQNDNRKYSVKYQIYKIDGYGNEQNLGKLITEEKVENVLNYRTTLNQTRKEIIIENPQLWNHEKPELYLILVSLYDENNKYLESVSFTTGFKTVSIKNRELLINGKMVYIKGVNRHEHNEYNGKTLTTEEMLKDIKIMKQYNFNAVRTCHYPDDERWYDLCNRYGLYILDEANIENHAYYDCMTRSDEWTNAYMQRITRMVRRDKNNVCIFGWSLGNESGDGQNQVAAQAWIRRVDPTRIVHYEGFVRPALGQGDFTLDSLARGKGLTDFIGPMYPSIELIKKYANTIDDYRPIIMCEYSHAMGNANGSISDYWKAIYSTHGLQGGFIWDWIDQGLAASAPEGKPGTSQGGKYWKYGGDFGDSPADYDFCLNGIMFPDQTPKPAMEECKYLFAPVEIKAVHKGQGIFEVTNHFDFSTLENVELKWAILKNGISIKEDTLKLDSILPEEKQTIKLNYENFDAEEDDYYINFYFTYKEKTSFAQKGFIFGTEQFLLNKGTDYLTFDTKNEAKTEETILISQIKPVIFRALTENECVKRELPTINFQPTPFAFINKPTKEWINKDIQNSVLKFDENLFEIYTGPAASKSEKLAECIISYSESENSENEKYLEIQADFTLTENLSEYPCVGLELPVSNKYKQITWYGNGPFECYSDRKKAAFTGLYTKELTEMEVPYIVPQENGSRTGTTYICLASDAEKLQLQSATPFTFNILPYSQEDLWKCEHHNELVNLSKIEGDEGKYILRIYAALRGVGTGACGPDTLEQYKVKPGKYSLKFRIY